MRRWFQQRVCADVQSEVLRNLNARFPSVIEVRRFHASDFGAVCRLASQNDLAALLGLPPRVSRVSYCPCNSMQLDHFAKVHVEEVDFRKLLICTIDNRFDWSFIFLSNEIYNFS